MMDFTTPISPPTGSAAISAPVAGAIADSGPLSRPSAGAGNGAPVDAATGANPSAHPPRVSLAERMVAQGTGLIIEPDPSGHGFVYKSRDHNTGEYHQIWPIDIWNQAKDVFGPTDPVGITVDQTA